MSLIINTPGIGTRIFVMYLVGQESYVTHFQYAVFALFWKNSKKVIFLNKKIHIQILYLKVTTVYEERNCEKEEKNPRT